MNNVLYFVYELSGLMVFFVLYSLVIQHLISNPQELLHLVKNRFTNLSEHKTAEETLWTLCSSNVNALFILHDDGIASLIQ